MNYTQKFLLFFFLQNKDKKIIFNKNKLIIKFT